MGNRGKKNYNYHNNNKRVVDRATIIEMNKKITGAKTLRDAEERFKEVDRNVGADVYSFNRMMNWALKAKKIRVVFRYFDMMEKRDLNKSVVTYNIAINACNLLCFCIDLWL